MNKQNLEKAVALRHEIHQNPDLSNQERPTYERIIKFLKENTKNIEIVDKGHYVYAVYRSPKKGNPNIAFRCDCDAILVDDDIDVPYKSCKPGIGHKCGHDGHTATMCALAMDLDENGADRDVYMLFQPAEENGSGAASCVDFITDNKIDEIFGFHGSVEEDYGVVQYKDGLMNCASKGICIEMIGAPTHASLPENGKNPSFAISKTALASEAIAADKKYTDLVMATIVNITVGEKDAYGVAASRGVLQITIRGAKEAEMDDLQKRIEEEAAKDAKEYGLELNITYSDAFPETVNCPELNEKLLNVCKKLGIPTAKRPEAERGSEDFGHFSKLTKGTIFFGCFGKDKPNMHTSAFNFDDSIIEMIINIYRGLIEEI